MAKPKNVFAVVQDRSGSMGYPDSMVTETINGFNSYVSDLKDKAEGKNRLSLYQFDYEYTPVVENAKLKDVPVLDRSTFVPRGSTALLDAVGRTIDNLKSTVNDEDSVTVIVMTDGGENASQDYSAEKVKSMIADLEENANWTFVFLGAGPAAWQGGNLLGIKTGNTLNYGAGAHNHGVAFRNVAAASVTRSSLALQGVAKTDSYFADAGIDNDTPDEDDALKAKIWKAPVASKS